MFLNISSILSDVIKFILILNMCKTMSSYAEPRFDGSEIYSKLCSVIKIPRFCYPYLLGSYSSLFPLYNGFPLPPFPPPVLPIAPFPLILSPTSPNLPFTIPTVYTTKSPSGQSGGQSGGQNQGGGAPVVAPIPIPSGGNCPPIGICPPAALSGPIDPRQVLRQLNGCPCMDPRVGPLPGAVASGPGPIPSGPGQLVPQGPIGASVPVPVPPVSISRPPPGAVPQIRPARLEQAPILYPRLSREVLSEINNCAFPNHHCIHLRRCTYFEHLVQADVDAQMVGSELRKLFCGFDGFDIKICCPMTNQSASNSGMSNMPSTKLYAPAKNGFAHDNGLIFSGLNSQATNTITNPIIVVPSESQILKPMDPSMQSSNVNNFIDYGSNYITVSPSQQFPEKPAKPQPVDVSPSFTFAPLLAASALPPPPLMNNKNNISSSLDLISQINQLLPFTSKPPISIPMPKPKNRCGISKFTDSRVVGGSITQSGQYPWIAALGYRFPNMTINGLQFYCAGSLITRAHVLTSAHCVSPFLRLVRLGAYDLSAGNYGSDSLDFTIEKTIVHEEYKPDIILNDIAIVKLRRQAPVNDHIRPICLPLFEPLRSSNLIGYSPFVAGWGSTFFLGPQSSILRDTQVPIIPTSECKKSYESKYSMQVFDDRIICAGSGAHDACQGDSGSEMSDGSSGFYYVLVGLVSYGYECAKDGFPGVYTKISTFLPWIQQNLA